MPWPQIDNTDKSIVDPAEKALRDPRVRMVERQPDGVPFDYNRPQQNWVIDGAGEDVAAFKLARKAGAPDFDNPRLVVYAVPPQWASVPNIQENPSMDGFVQPYSPVPLRALAADESLVTLGAGAFNIPQIYLRKGEAPAPPAPPSTGGGFTDADRKQLAFVVQGVKTLIDQ